MALVLALTGLVWGFQWFAQTVYSITGGEKSLVYQDPGSLLNQVNDEGQPAIDKVWHIMRKEYPQAKAIEVHIPETDSSSIPANANLDEGTYWQMDYRYFDQFTFEEYSVDHIYGRLAYATAADKLMRMNYDIHTGAIIGFPGKLLAFLQV